MMLIMWSVVICLFIGINSVVSKQCEFNSMCTCSSKQDESSFHSIICTTVPFYKFPTLPQKTINYLEIVGSKISILEAESLSGTQVQSLILPNNNIQQIAEYAFSTTSESITSIDVSFNNLNEIPFLQLKGLKNLQWINLHANQISTILGDWSHMKNTVSTLFLGGNDIAEIPNETSASYSKNQYSLKQLKFLEWLNLDENRIYKIHKNSLPQALQTVSLSHNMIENFPFDIIFSAPRLQWIYLRGNHIRSIPEIMMYSRKMWLEKLDLSENYIKRMPEWPFNNSLYIREINLGMNDFQTLTNFSFSGFDSGKIIISYNYLRHMEVEAFHGIENNLEYLDLDHNHFREIPEALGHLKKIKYLYLSFNYLSHIQNNSFDTICNTLKALSLSGNFFRQIPSDGLQNCVKLTYLNMASNEITNISEDNFKNWGENMKTLLLSKNNIEQLNRGTFSVLKELKDLSLSFNPVQEIDVDVFQDLDKLETLDMSFVYNRNGFEFDLLKPLKKLKWLSLDYNNIRILKDTYFETLPEVQYININSNELEGIPVNLFKSSIHTDLKELRFYDNRILELNSYTFDDLRKLEIIFLTKNRIRTVSKFAFNNLDNLSQVLLNNNHISHIEPYAFNNLLSLKELNLNNNLLKEISFESFTNISSSFVLNLSMNQMSDCKVSKNFLQIDVLDMKYNRFDSLPQCIKHTTALKKLYLDYNFLTSIEPNELMHLTSVEEINLKQNNIMYVSERAFVGLRNLQILNLSENFIRHLHVNLFTDTPNLRILDLRNNSLTYLPKDIFRNTLLEMLDISYNSFSVVPSQIIWDISKTLRHLSIGDNSVEHLDIQTFPHTPQLQHLDLRNNKLSLLPDNVFSGLGFLQNLDLSSNPLRTNFKELFHYSQNLLYLNLAGSKITIAPHFPLPKLLHLNLSQNSIEHISKNSVKEISKLRLLDLSFNNIKQIPSHIWIHLPNLKILYLSNNPLKQLISDSFLGLSNLQNLYLTNLKHLNRFESKSILQLKILQELSIQSWPNLDHFNDQFCHLLAHIHQLRILQIEITEETLDNQFLCNTNRKLKKLVISGSNLKFVQKDAFDKFSKNTELDLKIHGTQIKELPSELFSKLHRVSYLAIDLSRNLLTHFDPGIFYGNFTMSKNLDTRIISGGLIVSNNPLRCNCHLSWFSHWLRQWMKESIPKKHSSIEDILKLDAMLKESTCTDENSGAQTPIVNLLENNLDCHASALSDATHSSTINALFIALCTVYFPYYN